MILLWHLVRHSHQQLYSLNQKLIISSISTIKPIYILKSTVLPGTIDYLSSNFPKQVRNSALAENTILGVSTGLALAGKKPIAFMQFSDFLPVAYNHLLSEIGAMYWRSNGQWNAPVTVMAIAGGYRPGLGPYHAQTLESICAHIPGIDVFMPSNEGILEYTGDVFCFLCI